MIDAWVAPLSSKERSKKFHCETLAGAFTRMPAAGSAASHPKPTATGLASRALDLLNRNEQELRLPIDERANEPRAGHPVDLDVGARDPFHPGPPIDFQSPTSVRQPFIAVTLCTSAMMSRASRNTND